jgi:hypothetical protein
LQDDRAAASSPPAHDTMTANLWPGVVVP